jgi:phage nucleotide-binding protein
MKIKSCNDSSSSKLTIVINGKSGVGKTSLAKTIEAPVLLISAESGVLSLKGSKVDYIDIAQNDDGSLCLKHERIRKLQEAYVEILKPEYTSKYKWLYIDSLTEISQCLQDTLLMEYPAMKDSMLRWNAYNERMRAILKSFRDIPHYNVVMTCLESVEKDELGRRYIGFDIAGKISNQLPAFFDEVFYYYIAKNEDGTDKRILLTQPTDSVIAKDRSGKLLQMEEPNLQNIINKITKGK